MTQVPCSCCNDPRQSEDFNYFADRCTWCQARRIQYIQRVLRLDQDTKRRRCQAVIEDVQSWGLDEAEVRRLAKLPERALQPVTAAPAPAQNPKRGRK